MLTINRQQRSGSVDPDEGKYDLFLANTSGFDPNTDAINPEMRRIDFGKKKDLAV